MDTVRNLLQVNYLAMYLQKVCCEFADPASPVYRQRGAPKQRLPLQYNASANCAQMNALNIREKKVPCIYQKRNPHSSRRTTIVQATGKQENLISYLFSTLYVNIGIGITLL